MSEQKKSTIKYVAASILAISAMGIGLVKTHEGKRNTAYRDPVGIPTICYGHTKTAKMGTTLTDAQCTILLKSDLDSHAGAVNKYVNVPVSQQQYDALVSFTYNVGAGNLQKSTLLKKLNRGDYCGAANEFSKWNRARGKVLPGLTKRRAEEKALFLSGTKEDC